LVESINCYSSLCAKLRADLLQTFAGGVSHFEHFNGAWVYADAGDLNMIHAMGEVSE
jgi:hypothetical protein